jgi:catechol 2,3-dioxygenase-like lactoylglutathione lyase family enzyme
MIKIFCITLAVLYTIYAKAQSPSAYKFYLNHIAISVKDVDRSAAFYRSVLNLEEITNRSKLEGVRWFSLGDGKELHLISIVKENVTLNKALHLALSTNNFDDFVKRLDSLKMVYSDWAGTPHKLNIRADGVKQAFFQDPDGYWIEVNSIGK